jgi:hypothetical protein
MLSVGYLTVRNGGRGLPGTGGLSERQQGSAAPGVCRRLDREEVGSGTVAKRLLLMSDPAKIL